MTADVSKAGKGSIEKGAFFKLMPWQTHEKA